MNKSFKKVIVTVLATTAIFSFHNHSLASTITLNMPTVIHESIEKKNIASGVTYEKLMKFTTSGWWNINILRVDLEDPYTEIKSLINTNGISNRATISSMVNSNNALAGINGDYFNYTPYAVSLSALIDDKEVISARRDDSTTILPNFFIDFLNNGSIGYLQRTMTLTNSEKNITANINAVNSISSYFDMITMLNRKWGKLSIGTKYNNDLMEVVVVDDIITDIRVGKEAVEIPENGYVLLTRGARTNELLQFSIGDKVQLAAHTTPNIEDIKFAIGGGSYVLQNGVLKTPDLSSPGNHPRTAIGISQDQKEIILMTIDGRGSSFVGVTQEMAGAILKDLGAYNAIVMDGGGSTTMAIKPLGSQSSVVVNNPSEGSERPVVNGVGVFNNAPIGDLSYIEASTDDKNMFKGTQRKITVQTYDQYHNPMEVDENKITLEILEGKGSVNGNYFKAQSYGNIKLKVYYENVSSNIELNVLNDAKDLNTSISTISIDKDSEIQLPNFIGVDEYGRDAIIYPQDLDFDIINGVGEISDGIFYSSTKSKSGAITVKLNDAIENILVYVGYEEKVIEEFNSLTKFKFSSYPISTIGEIKRNTKANSKDGRSIAIKYDFSQGVGTRAAYLNFNHDDGAGLVIDGLPKKLGVWLKGDGQNIWLRGIIKDNTGKEHYIDFGKHATLEDWQFVTADIPSTVVYPISIQKIYPVETKDEVKTIGEISLDQLTALYSFSIDNLALPASTTVIDTKNVQASISNTSFTFSIFQEPHNINQLTQYDALSTVKNKLSNNKTLFSFNGFTQEFLLNRGSQNLITLNNGYSINSTKDLKFINLNTSKKGIRVTNSSQWKNLLEQLNTTSTDNIIITVSTPIWGDNGFTDKLEADLLHDYLSKAFKNGKNIFVIQNSSQSNTALKDGVRYIEINSSPLEKPEDIYNLSMVEFISNGSDLTYVIKPLFQKPSITVLK